MSSHLSLGGDFLITRKEQAVISGKADSNRRCYRIEAKIGFNSLSSRSYFAYNIKENDKYLSWFASIKYYTANLENIEVWSNMERIENGIIEYWYLYVKTTQTILNSISLSFKLGNAHRRNAGLKNQTVMSVELIAAI